MGNVYVMSGPLVLERHVPPKVSPLPLREVLVFSLNALR